MQFDLSVIIVTYKAKDLVKEAIRSVMKSETTFSFEIIVIDNASNDGTVEMVTHEFIAQQTWHERMVLYKNTNEGFPKGNNRAMRLKRGQYVLLLNPDTKVEKNTLEVMMRFMKERTDVGISTCKLVKANGELDAACRRSVPTPWVAFARLSGLSFLFPNNKTFAKYNLSYKSIDEETEIDACVGAFMLVSPECLSAIGPMDERFYMYGEDLDWCMSAQQKGFKVWYYPKTTTIHYKGQSSKKASVRSLHAFHEAMWLFYKKHFRVQYFYILDPFVYVGIWSRYLVKRIQNLFRSDPFVSK